MERKVVEGPVRSREKSKQKLLNAVGKILKTKGFTALKVNDIATTAGLDKKLIYNYFGGVDQLIDEYIRSQDFWSNITLENAADMPDDGGREFMRLMLLSQFDYVAKNKELQKILLWGLYESRKSLKRVADDREIAGEVLLKHISDPFFGEKALHFRALMAIIVSGIYYLDMFTAVNGKTFCGIDLTQAAGRTEIKKALESLVTMIYETQQPVKKKRTAPKKTVARP
ncbi:TetR/AcrR family transcriptional regulator [Taibaiella chishuiensis]|uniref:TetR family transcriptional regulator n=1 Tax=Taibaiella chishuiensis TaxID=1434707 RepID=A0A2P8D373_9BACT|nr:TetR/AcrR family transcriptional regulator [Taibaiella chishuiensis]PSK91626.1 TetR family transcriptional regulator [Taibaiella chishuiensis]